LTEKTQLDPNVVWFTPSFTKLIGYNMSANSTNSANVNQTFEVYRNKSLLPKTVLMCLFKGFLPVVESPDIKDFIDLGDKTDLFIDIVSKWSSIGFMEVDLYEIHRTIEKQYALITDTYGDQSLSHTEITNRVSELTEELYRQMLHRQSIMLSVKKETKELIDCILTFSDKGVESDDPVPSKHSDIQAKLQDILIQFTSSSI
jgi:hypothetical protein